MPVEAKGSNPMLMEAPSITCPGGKDGKGKERQLRRLGIKQLFALAKMVKQAIIWGSMDFQSRFKRAMDYQNKEDVLYLVLMGLTEVEEPFIKFFAETMGVSEKEITNPDLFPLGTEVQFIKALMEHPDVKVFFEQMGSETEPSPLLDQLKGHLKTRSETGSTPSTDSGVDTT